MRTLRPLPLVLLLGVAVGCARCGGPGAAPPVDRFVAADSAAVLVVPTLEGFAQQSADLLATAATFPGGKELIDARSVVAGRLTFDPFDPAAIAGAGLDPKRGAALSAVVGKGGENAPDVVLSLPVGDAAKFEAAVTKIARERLDATERTVEAGAPQVVAWRPAAGGPILFAYAVVERTALVSGGASAVEAIRAAAAVPAGGGFAGRPEYQKLSKALGAGLALQFFVPSGSPALKEFPQLKQGFGGGVRGGKDRLGVAGAMLLGDKEAAVKAAAARGESAALLAKLDPASALVLRGDGDPSSSMDFGALAAALEKEGIPPELRRLGTDFYTSLGAGGAMGLAVVPADGKGALVKEAPLRFLRVEILASLKDPAKMTATIQDGMRFFQAASRAAVPAKGKRAAAPAVGGSPWRMPVEGGEAAVAVADGRLAVVFGPEGSLEALLARGGSTFKGPTAASDQALHGGTSGLLLDVPRLLAGVQAIPSTAYGEGQDGMVMKGIVDQVATAAERVTAISVSGELVEGAARGELLVEVKPAAATAAAK